MALGIVQARMSSTRLPGKALADLDGEPVLALVLRRLERSQELDRIVVATTTESSDDGIERVAGELGCDVYRGSRDDVLGRFVGAANGHEGPLVRVTADCPFIDPEVVDETIRLFERTPGCAYASNLPPSGFPEGIDTEVFSAETLRWADERARTPSEREHVTPVIREDLGALTAATLTHDEELGDLHWSIDTGEDLEFVRAVVGRLGARRYAAGFVEILNTLREPPSLADFGGRRG